MPDHESVTPSGAPGPDDSRLPVPASERRPASRASRTVSVARPESLARALAGAPLVAASVVGAAAAAAMTGAAVVSRLMWPWTDRRELPWPGAQPRSPSSLVGPGVHISYTRVEVHWPLDR
ncbi:hypothetical protein ACVGVM_00850 [Pseudonocardia bannensis]|uniref:Uncharacterized protein n=1 Tax=Pseudonocardia bannensis TaxID=630973 RepID=A0A848DCD1_9PSEU|nr:hypothetical protein [Pseudonocardia bannensis]NMH90079.1 hypothetical protein [Pseudonocardia bannensis]